MHIETYQDVFGQLEQMFGASEQMETKPTAVFEGTTGNVLKFRVAEYCFSITSQPGDGYLSTFMTHFVRITPNGGVEALEMIELKFSVVDGIVVFTDPNSAIKVPQQNFTPQYANRFTREVLAYLARPLVP